MKKTIPFIFLLTISVLLSGCSLSANQKLCTENNGTWIAEYQECESLAQDVCESSGGVFDECGSACRHQTAEDGEIQACTMQCVPFCDFRLKTEAPEEDINLKDCAVYFDGCNNCLITENNELMCANGICPKNSTKKPQCLKFKDIHTTKTIEEETPNLTLKVEYPVTEDKDFNTLINTFVINKVNDFKKVIGEERISPNWKNGFYITFETFTYSKDIRSYKFNITEYSGGAHDNLYFKTFTYNFAKQKQIGFRDLFQEEHDPLWTIVPLTQKQLSQTIGDNRMMQMGTEEKPENYENFALTPQELLIFFPPYQVAAWAAGPQMVSFMWIDLNAILKPLFFLGNK